MTTVTSLFTPLDTTKRPGVEGSTSLAEDFDSFLNLLTVQLRNQDPLEPLDSNQFTQQLVQMTEVEQSVSMNERLGALIDAQETQRIQSAVDFVGKHADALGDIVPLGDDGADMFYALQTPASSIEINIVDANEFNVDKRVVRTLQAPGRDAGVHRLTWDGLDKGGLPVDPDRVYRMEITASDTTRQPINPKIGFSGVVDEIRHDEGALILSIAGKQVGLDQIVAARTASFQPTQSD